MKNDKLVPVTPQLHLEMKVYCAQNNTPFIPYRDYGMNMSCNLMVSFFSMYPETKVSNEYLSKRLVLSSRQVKRVLSDLIQDEFIFVEYPSSRKRIIKLNLDKIKSELSSKESKSKGQNVPQVEDNTSLIGDNMSLLGDKMSLIEDNMSPYKKPYNKPFKKPLLETLYKNPDNNTTTSKDILNDILKTLNHE